MKPFKSILEFQKYFDTEEKCRAYLEEQRWGGRPVCPHCKSDKVYRLKDNRRFNCGNPNCKRIFTVTVGTMYENTKLPLTKWFLANYILSVHSKGISSLQLANILGIGQKAAWFLNHRIRQTLTDELPQKLNNVVEADETVIGGKERNRHQSATALRLKRQQRATEGKFYKLSPTENKTMVGGMVERGGKVVTKVLPDTKGRTLKLFVQWNVVKGAKLYTDEHKGYVGLSKFYLHESVRHSMGEYVRGNAHTNTIEGF